MFFRLFLPENQFGIVCDATDHEGSSVVLKKTSCTQRRPQTYPPVVVGSCKFSTCQMLLIMCAEEVSTIQFVLKEFDQTL